MQIVITGASLPNHPSAYGLHYLTLDFNETSRAHFFVVHSHHPHLAVIYIYIEGCRLFQKVRMWLYQDEATFGPNRNITILI